MTIKKYVEIFGNEDCPCNHCPKNDNCDSSQRDNYTDEELEQLEEITKVKDELRYLRNVLIAKEQFENDYKMYKETGDLPSRYDPDKEDSIFSEIDECYLYDINKIRCPYIQEYIYHTDYDDEVKTDCDSLAVESGYKDYVDEIYKTYKGVEIINGLAVTRITQED